MSNAALMTEAGFAKLGNALEMALRFLLTL